MFKKLTYMVSYTALAIVVLSVFFILRPFSYTDHEKSIIICNKNKTSHTIGPSFFFLFNETFDQITDKNIRKLCEYSIIGDYQNSFSTPTSINYTILYEYEQESNWLEVILLISAIFLFGSLIIEKLCQLEEIHKKKRIYLILTSLGIASLIFFIVFFMMAKSIYCTRKAAILLSHFKTSAYGYGLSAIQKQEFHLYTVLDSYIRSCLKK